jgi:membrane-associated phospholipid phosphatase
MSATNVTVSQNYASRLVMTLWASLAQLVRTPSHSRRAEARRRSARHVLWLAAGLSALIIALMYGLDAAEIRLMPPRGTASLWPFRILTDFGKSAYVLWVLAGLLFAVLAISAAARGTLRILLLGLGTRLQFIFLAVLVPILAGEVLKLAIGRGRPFVGGDASAFHFSHFHGSEAYQSLPSGHAITAFALAFAVSALWPRLRYLMLAYAIVIAATRLVLLAHHPSDVVAGALVGVVGAMFVRYWFAARKLAFAIDRDGSVLALPGPTFERFKRVARNPFDP